MTRPATPPGHTGSHGHGHHHHGTGKGKGHDKHNCPVNPCLLAGTEILTDRGYMPIEELEVGDVLMTSKGPQPILHISRRDYTAEEIAADDSLLPYAYVPGQDRWVVVSKHHRIAVDFQLKGHELPRLEKEQDRLVGHKAEGAHIPGFLDDFDATDDVPTIGPGLGGYRIQEIIGHVVLHRRRRPYGGDSA